MNKEAKQWVAVVGLVFRGDLLLAMRRAPDRDAGAGIWEAISGRVAAGEDPLVAVIREIAEESGLSTEVHPAPIDSYAAMRGAEPMTVIVYRAEYRAGELRCSEEHDACRWCTLAEFAELGAPPRLVEAAKNGLRWRTG